MTTVSDTSPLSALAEIGELECLRQLYGSVVIPEMVRRECTAKGSPPPLVERLSLGDPLFVMVPDPEILDEAAGLDPGEASAISVAWCQIPDCTLLIDDLEGRTLCEAIGIPITGTAGVLAAAAREGILDFEDALSRLQTTSFRLGPAVVEEVRDRLRSWCQPPLE